MTGAGIKRICVVIPTLNREWKVLECTLNSLLPLLAEEDSLIIVDQNDNEIEDLAKFCEGHSPKVKRLRITEKGLPNARNVGIKNAPVDCDVILFCDDDIVASAGLIEGHRRRYRDADIGGVAGRVFRTGGREKGIESGTVGKFRAIDANFVDNFDAKFETYTDSVYGCNMSFRRDVLVKIGGFDKRFGGSAHLEESDTAISVKNTGYKIIFAPDAELEHVYFNTGGCRLKTVSEWVHWYGHNYTLFFLKHFNKCFLPVFLCARVSRMVLWCFEEKSVRPLLRGIAGIIKGMKSFAFVKKQGL